MNNDVTTLRLIAFANLQIGIVMVLVSIPLILRKVPMNQFYGVRIPVAFKSEELWYDINAYGGRQLASWSSLLIVAGVIGFCISAPHFSTYAYACVVNALVAFSMPMFLIFRYARKKS